MTDDDKWYVVSDEKAQSIIEVLKQISPSAAGEDTLAKYSDITVNSLSLKNTVIATQFPDIYIVTGRGINRFDHPRYGDEMLQSGSWVAVIDIKCNKIILRVSADDLGKPQCFAGERIPGNLFDVSEPVAVAVSNNGADCVISCSENKLFSQTLCTSKEFENVDMEYILPTISDDYFIFVGKKRIAIAYMTKDQFRIKWEIGSEREFSLLGFNRLNSTLTIAAKGSKPVTYEILWNFEEPSMDSGIVEWDDLDYHGPVKRRSSYF